MKKEKQTIDDLLTAFEEYLLSLKRSRFTIRQYKSIWKNFKDFTVAHGIHFYDHSVGDQFIESLLGNYLNQDLSQIEKRLVNTIDALYVFPTRRRPVYGTCSS